MLYVVVGMLYVVCCMFYVVVGALVVQLVESWVYDPEDIGGHWFESQGKRKKEHQKFSSPPAQPSVKRVPGLVLGEQSTPSPPAQPSVKRVPGLVLGEQSTPTVSHCTTNGSGGTTGCPHRQWEA